MTLVDCHAHMDQVPEIERAAVLERSRQAGVAWIINAADDAASCGRVAELARQVACVYGTLGVHPHNAKDVTDETVNLIEDGLVGEKIIGVGEIGLDFHYDLSPRDKQIEAFGRFMDMALRHDLPVVVHQRESAEQIVASMKPYCAKGLRGMIHCFSGDWDFAKACLDMGLYISFSGILTFKKAQGIQDVAAKAPADRILLETDAPWLAPVPLRGKPNEPAYMVHTAERLAALRGQSMETLAEQVLGNSNALFHLSLR